jgi:phage terminase small subunit
MNDLITDDEPKADGQHMKALMSRQQKFVHEMLKYGPGKENYRHAAVAAGFAPNHGYVLMRDERILAAIREEATKRVAGAALMGVTVMIDIARTNGHKDQFRAAKELAALNGFTAEQRIVVEHVNDDTRDKIQQIKVLAEKMGLDPRQLVASAGVVVDAEFEPVKPVSQVDDSDW